ncbi:tyrosine-type recombinase/integrase [Streptomyces sp. NPDC005148]
MFPPNGAQTRRRVPAPRREAGWDAEYDRDVWRLRELHIECDYRATIRFVKIPQPWLKKLAKRWARWRLATGLSPATADSGTKAVARFSAFLAVIGVNSLSQVDRSVLERYLADLRAEALGEVTHSNRIGQLNTFFTAIRRHGWDATLPTTALFFPDDYPEYSDRLPRALSELVMAQLESPDNLDRWDHPVHRLITLILMRCGLRIADATQLPRDCIVHDGDGAPYLRYFNHKMKREALVPIDEELERQIVVQQAHGASGLRVRHDFPPLLLMIRGVVSPGPEASTDR